MADIKHIDPKELKAWLDSGEAILVDVREPAEYDAAHIEGATLMPLGKVCKSVLPNAGNKKIVVHCKLGKRGNMACEKLLKEDPSLPLYNLTGGIDAWQQCGLGVQYGQAKISVDRQIQITVGTGVLAGLLLGYFFSPVFLLLAAFFGAGMLYSGLKGSCMMAMLFARMPWNR